MSDATENVERSGGDSSDGESIGHLLEGPSWEQRVAAAREKRMKALALKAQRKADAAPREEPSPAVVVPLTPPDLQSPEGQEAYKKVALAANTVAVAPSTIPEAAVAEPAVSEPAVAEVAVAETTDKRGFKGGALLLVACCAALGFGVALGAGIVMSTQSDRPAQVSDVLETKTIDTAAEGLPTAPVTSASSEGTVAEIALATAPAPVENIEGLSTSEGLSVEPSVAERIGDVRVSLPQQGPNLDDAPGTPYDVAAVNYRGDVQRLLSPRPASGALKDVSQPVPPQVSFELGIGAWDQAADALRLSLEAANTSLSKVLSPNSYQSSVPAPANDASGTTENLDAAPEIDVAAAGLDVFVVLPSANLTTPAAPDAALEALSAELELAAVLTATTPNRPELALPQASKLALLPPEVETWNGVLIRPIERPTLASTLGYTGTQAEVVNLVLHAPSGVEQDVLDAQTQRVEGTGFAVSKTVRPQFKISKSHLRFYNEADRDLANAIATEMGFALRDFSSTNARSGLIEIWLEGGPTPGAAQPSTTARAARPSRQRTAPRNQSRPRPASQLDQLRNNLLNRLRNGDHL